MKLFDRSLEAVKASQAFFNDNADSVRAGAPEGSEFIVVVASGGDAAGVSYCATLQDAITEWAGIDGAVIAAVDPSTRTRVVSGNYLRHPEVVT